MIRPRKLKVVRSRQAAELCAACLWAGARTIERDGGGSPLSDARAVLLRRVATEVLELHGLRPLDPP